MANKGTQEGQCQSDTADLAESVFDCPSTGMKIAVLFAFVVVTVEDETLSAHRQQIEDVRSRGAAIVQLHHSVVTAQSRILPLLILQRFYLDVEVVARSRGINPDAPPGLNKVTKTV